MREDVVKMFQGRKVKLVKTGGFVLHGTIEMVYSDSVLFLTSSGTSLFRLDGIGQIVEQRGRKG